MSKPRTNRLPLDDRPATRASRCRPRVPAVGRVVRPLSVVTADRDWLELDVGVDARWWARSCCQVSRRFCRPHREPRRPLLRRGHRDSSRVHAPRSCRSGPALQESLAGTISPTTFARTACSAMPSSTSPFAASPSASRAWSRCRLELRARARRDSGSHRPQRRRQDHAISLISGTLKPKPGRADVRRT